MAWFSASLKADKVTKCGEISPGEEKERLTALTKGNIASIRPGGRFLHVADCRLFRGSCLLTLSAYCNLPAGIRGGNEVFL